VKAQKVLRLKEQVFGEGGWKELVVWELSAGRLSKIQESGWNIVQYRIEYDALPVRIKRGV